jgi:hypothetical protein
MMFTLAVMARVPPFRKKSAAGDDGGRCPDPSVEQSAPGLFKALQFCAVRHRYGKPGCSYRLSAARRRLNDVTPGYKASIGIRADGIAAGVPCLRR